MKLIRNSGNDRAVDELRQCLVAQGTLDVASPAFSLFAFSEIQELLAKLAKCRLVVPADGAGDLLLLGTAADRTYRNRLQSRWLARQCARWLEANADVKSAPGAIPQSTLIAGSSAGTLTRVITGNCPFTTEGLGITPGNQFSLIQAAESPEECALLGSWFTGLWNSLPASPEPKRALLARITVWPAPSLPADVLASYKPETAPDAYSIADHPRLVSGSLQPVFQALRKEVLALDPCVTEEFFKLYVAYKAETDFVDMEPQAKRLLLALNMAFADIDDPKGMCRDVTDIGHHGTGNVIVGIASLDDVPYVMGLVRQALEKQMDAVNGA